MFSSPILEKGSRFHSPGLGIGSKFPSFGSISFPVHAVLEKGSVGSPVHY